MICVNLEKHSYLNNNRGLIVLNHLIFVPFSKLQGPRACQKVVCTLMMVYGMLARLGQESIWKILQKNIHILKDSVRN